MIAIRRAEVSDAAAIGGIHVRAWQAAYRGAMPDAYLDGLSEAERASAWARGLQRRREEAPVLVAELEGVVIGFASVGPAPDPPGAGELVVINIDPGHWGRGVGQRLLLVAEHELARLGFPHAVLWVLPSNHRARRFYEAAGWEADGEERVADVLGVTVPEVRYRRRLLLGASPTDSRSG